jgi:crotonobetainyl-CoA:carnitine CoA-transferase CaiB-like acyl-CoA transferase
LIHLKLLTHSTLTYSAPPLEGIRVVDLSTVLSGPLAASMLADQGAQVIKVESLEGDTCRLIGPAKGDLSAMYIATNRGKKSLAMDLKSPQAKAILVKLLAKADVVINNFRPGVMARLGLDDDALVAINPRLIRCDSIWVKIVCAR